MLGVHTGQEIRREFEELLFQADAARGHLGGEGGEMVDHLRRILERLAFEEPGQQEISLLPQAEFVIEIEGVVDGQQAPTLQFDQGGGDQQELRRQLEVTCVDALDLGQVGIDDLEQRHLVQVDFVSKDQMEEKIERAFEHPGSHSNRGAVDELGRCRRRGRG
jgi:hypothetical protein